MGLVSPIRLSAQARSESGRDLMTSSAHADWTNSRRQRLADLDAARGDANQRSADVEQILWAITLRLAAEFQGYARDLHDLVADECVSSCNTVPGFETVLKLALTAKRDLDVVNAQHESVGNDFSRLGVPIWKALEAAKGAQAVHGWKNTLTTLNVARNAVAHGDPQKFAKLNSMNCPITEKQIGEWQKSLDELVDAMDEVVSNYLVGLLGINPPW